MKPNKERLESLMPNNMPKYVRCYDNGGETLDRYTVVFTGNYRNIKRGDQYLYLGMSEYPYQAIGQHGSSNDPIDRPQYSHLGKKIKFSDLPIDCKTCVIDDYKEIWKLE